MKKKYPGIMVFGASLENVSEGWVVGERRDMVIDKDKKVNNIRTEHRFPVFKMRN